MRIRLWCLWLMCTIAALAAPPAAAEEPQRFEFTRLAMGDRARVVVYTADEPAARAAAGAALDRIAELEAIMTDYRPESELMRLCAAPAGEPVRISEDLFVVLKRAKELAATFHGAYDPTVGPVVALWRESRKAGKLPDPDRLQAARALVGHAKLTLDEGARTATLALPGMKLDLGGIGKGYAADAAAAVLEAKGLRTYLVAIGGDIVVGDPPPGKEAWEVEVRSVLAAGARPVIRLVRGAVSTSGDLEQFVEIDGVRHSHIVSPKTGVGLTERSLVTVVAPDGATADAASTAMSVLGGLATAYAAEFPGLGVRLEEPDRESVLTAGMFPEPGDAPYEGRTRGE